MTKDLDTKTVAKIIARIKAASGQDIDEQQLETVLTNSFAQLKQQDPEKYITTMEELSDQLEDMAAEIAKLQMQS